MFSQARDQFPAKPYNEDGNPNFYSEENMKKRELLEKDPIVEEAINNFIGTIFPQAKAPEDIIPRDQYISQFFGIGKILRPNIEPEELQQIVKDDYEFDSHNGDVAREVSREIIYKSLYELADIWCPSIDPNEYKEFFSILNFRNRYKGQGNPDAYEVLK